MVKVCDSYVGKGRACAMARYVNSHPDRKFICACETKKSERVLLRSCRGVYQKEVPKRICDRVEKYREVVDFGYNAVVSHGALLGFSRELVDRAHVLGYTLLIEGGLDVIQDRKQIDKDDMKLLLDTGLGVMKSDHTMVRGSQVTDCAELKRSVIALEAGTYVLKPDGEWAWVLAPDMLTKVGDTIIFDRYFDRTSMKRYLDCLQIPYERVGAEVLS